MAAWHLKTMTPATTFNTPGVAQNVGLFHEDKVSENYIQNWFAFYWLIQE